MGLSAEVPQIDALTPQFRQHLQKPHNAGHLENPDAAAASTNPACGDELRLEIRVRDGRVEQARFQASGCSATIAAGSALTQLIEGCGLEEVASRITPEALEAELGGLPPHRRHAAALASEVARTAAALARPGGQK